MNQPEDGPEHRIFVVADNYGHFQTWCWDRNWHARHPNLTYVTSGFQLRGYSGIDLRVIGWPSLTSSEADHLHEVIEWIREAQCPRPATAPPPLTVRPFTDLDR